MSVQAGIWNFDGRPVDRELLADIGESLKNQSPDGEFWYVDGSVALLYRPFHTTAESRREKQPYFSDRGFILTWDGRLDNRDDLIEDLRTNLEAEPTDVAIVAAAFDRWETECFHRMVGDWALSIWKPEQRELTLAVDYIASRHIFYYVKKHCVWWSTDLAPLVLLSRDAFHIDDQYVAGYFAGEPEANLTPYREISRVPPGRFVCVRDGRAIDVRYWNFSPKSPIRYKSDTEYEEHFRHIFRQSVRRRLRSDSPILAELSGGLDSSSIVCVADDIMALEGAQTVRVDTISYYDDTEPNGDDSTYFTKIEEKRGRRGYHIDASKFGDSLMSPKSTEFASLPGSFGFGRKIEQQRSVFVEAGGYRAILSGIGGDEFLGGIPNSATQLAELIVQFKPATMIKQLTAWALVKRRPWIQLLGEAFLELMPSFLRKYRTNTNIEPWIQKEFAKRGRLAAQGLDVDQHFGLRLPTQRSCASTLLLIAKQMAAFKTSPLAAEEHRFPYLDQSLIEFISCVPSDQLIRPRQRRSLMRRSLAGLVPQDILARETKQFGVRTPLVALERNLGGLEVAFHSSLSSSLGYIDNAGFLQALRGAGSGRRVPVVRILKAISLEFWLRDLVSRNLICQAAELAMRDKPLPGEASCAT